MKRLILFTGMLALLFLSKHTYAVRMSRTFQPEIISKEVNNVNGSLSFEIKYTFFDTTVFVQNRYTELKLPSGWSGNISPDVRGSVFNPDDSATSIVTINYPTNNLAFYPQKIEVVFSVVTRNGTKEISESAMVYFTPYYTTEIWNLYDFQNLSRHWYSPFENPDTTRVYVNPSDIPVSNIDSIVWNTTDWENDWQDNYREVQIKGLAYSILMKPVPPDSIDFYNNLADGTDSIIGNRSQTFNINISGRLTSKIINDWNDNAVIPLSGIKVKLIDKELAWLGGVYYETITSTYTNNNGEFNINMSVSQPNAEGSDMELYLKFKSRTSSNYQIISTNAIGSNYKFRVGELSNNESNLNIQLVRDKESYYDAFRAVHWANNGFRYFDEEGVSLGEKLRININAWGSGSRCLPPGISGHIWPVIHLIDDDGDRENTTYHEFGHFVLYKLQDNTFTIPLGTNGFSHSWSRENTGLLAWAEGFPNAVQMILDAAYWNEDDEYARDKWDFFEDRDNYSWDGNHYGNINNGFRSEYYIACAIYDLWDGYDKGLPNSIPGTNEFSHGYNDSQSWESWNWQTIDNVSLSLAEICEPIKNPKRISILNLDPLSNDIIINIGDYYCSLIDNYQYDCNMIRDISRVFKENRVLWNIAEYEWGWNNSVLSSDYFKNTIIKDEFGESQLYLINFKNWSENYYINLNNKDNINEYYFPAWQNNNDNLYPQNDLKIVDDLWVGIWDTFSGVYKKTKLYLNGEDNNGLPNLTHGDYYTCGGANILIRNGKLELGGTETTADLEVNSGSLLKIGSHGKLVINEGSTLIINCGADFQIEQGAEIVNNGDIIIRGNTLVGSNATFTFTGSGTLTKFGPPNIIIPFINNNSNTFIINSNTNIILAAQNSIKLKPGFKAEYGSNLHAYIDPNITDCGTQYYANYEGGEDSYYETNELIQRSEYEWNGKIDTIKCNEKDDGIKSLNTSLGQNFPNPHKGYTTIPYQVSEECFLKILIINQKGDIEKEIVRSRNHSVGSFEKQINLSDYKPGVYFILMQTDNYSQTRRMVIL